MKNVFFTVCAALLSLAFLFGCGGGSVRQQGDLPVIDLSLDYPKKDLSFQDIGGEMEYLPLETTDDVLLDMTAGIVAVSDKKIVITNSRQGDVFIFNRQGKVISHFNHKGQSGEEYPNMRIAIYDEKAMEILIYTYLNKLLVYSEDGKFKRSLSLPDKTSLTKLSNFDDETLLGYDEDGLYGTDYRTKPYLFI